MQALLDINVDVEPGEFVVALGAAGCGKSILLNLIAGFMALSEGEIRLGGRAMCPGVAIVAPLRTADVVI